MPIRQRGFQVSADIPVLDWQDGDLHQPRLLGLFQDHFNIGGEDGLKYQFGPLLRGFLTPVPEKNWANFEVLDSLSIQ